MPRFPLRYELRKRKVFRAVETLSLQIFSRTYVKIEYYPGRVLPPLLVLTANVEVGLLLTAQLRPGLPHGC